MLRARQEPIGKRRHAPCEENIVAGAMSRNVTVQPGFRVAMSSDRPEQTADDGVVADGKPACVALVPQIPAVCWVPVKKQQLSPADFITPLIATPQHVPPTPSLKPGP